MATFWIPLLAALFIEKHAIIGDPIHYTAGEWSVVFPLGMYSAATYTCADAGHVPFLANVARITVLIASATWILASIGLLRSALRSVKGK
ncbi:putative membrane protein (plasmid) [Caballeronia sp. SBC1]|nr:putative membrane protein [Caballeronia sp. SBC2]QIN67376.1 putative membrane protein [Caballeronia sp. SBC1]